MKIKRNKNLMNNMIKTLFLAVGIMSNSQVFAKNTEEPIQQALTPNSVKQTDFQHKLMAKLEKIHGFSANFTQQVYDNENQLIQQGSGNLKVAKPNKVYWQTLEPEETLIVSDGDTLWFYDPFIEQASAYSLQESIANTPILLIINNDPALWEQYHISELSSGSEAKYKITALNEQSQIKTLIITFVGNEISALTMTDATGQQSQIGFIDRNYHPVFDAQQFSFVVPEGVQVDDQR